MKKNKETIGKLNMIQTWLDNHRYEPIRKMQIDADIQTDLKTVETKSISTQYARIRPNFTNTYLTHSYFHL